MSATRAAAAGLWLVILSGPVLGLLALLAIPTGPDRPTGTPTPPAQTTSPLGPSEFASRYVKAWASGADSDALRSYFPNVPEFESVKHSQLSNNFRVARADELQPGYWAITISGDVQTETNASRPKDSSESNRRAGNEPTRYWRVGVFASGGPSAGGSGAETDRTRYTATSLPSLVSSPERVRSFATPYGTTVDGAPGSVGASTQGFLRLYLAGKSVERYVAPGSKITPPSPAAYLDAEVLMLSAAGDQIDLTKDSAPANGERIRVVATVRPHNEEGAGTVMDYALTLSGRDGRWEVSSLDQAPELGASRQPSGVRK